MFTFFPNCSTIFPDQCFETTDNASFHQNMFKHHGFVYRCITTKHGYQSKRTYGKVVHKQKMDSYIVG